MDEYEKLEEDLQKLYDEYMMKFRNQSYLEQCLEEFTLTEQNKAEVSFFISFDLILLLLCAYSSKCKW